MRKAKLLQEPSFLWDLYFIFYWKFNSKKLSNQFLSDENNANLIDFFKDTMFRFGEISNELSIFFTIVGEEDHTFIYDCYLKNFEKSFLDEYYVEHLHQELANKDQLLKNMIIFYFKDIISDDALFECFNSKEVLFEHIKTSYYSTEEKLKLYEFFINPIPYTKLLQRTVIEKQSLLLNYYNEHYKEILDAHDRVTIDSLAENIDTSEAGNEASHLKEYVSYCLIDKFHFDMITNSNHRLYLLGKDYDQNSESGKKAMDEPLLENFCYALSEKNRVQIFKLLYKEGELTCKDLERIFNFSGSTAYHHLSLMAKANLVKTRNEGKTIFYSINRQYFDDIIKLLRRLNN